ncbi:hypothetical protein CEK28_17875 [Xenophilus sp. AP218F]|nr:hypothetical protein CEK28_17875 [Xenophilus sp. AP218F]
MALMMAAAELPKWRLGSFIFFPIYRSVKMKKSVIAIAVLAAASGAVFAADQVADTTATVMVDGVKAPKDFGISANALERVQVVYNQSTKQFDVQNGGKTPIRIDVQNPTNSSAGDPFTAFKLEVAMANGKVTQFGQPGKGFNMGANIGNATVFAGSGYQVVDVSTLDGLDALDVTTDQAQSSGVTTISPFVKTAFGTAGGATDYASLPAGNYTGKMDFNIRATWTE